MITFIGILLILGAIGMFVFISIISVRTETKTVGDGYDRKTLDPHPKFIQTWNWKRSLIVGLVGFGITMIDGMFFYNPAGTATSVQYLWGGDQAVTSQGIKFQLWGKTIPISFEIAMQDVLGDVQKEEGIYYRVAQRREFSDAIKADIAASLIVSINYTDEDLFLEMADKNRSEQKLVYARIYPVYDQALKNTCKLMDAQDYISGAASQFDFYLKDQMENGTYLTEEVYADIPKENIGNDSTKTVAKGEISEENRQKKYRIRKDLNGDPVRDASNSLKRYGLTVQQAAVTNIDWEESFDERLKLQKEQVAQTQIEKQEAEKEFYATKKAVAKGEREKAEVRVVLEKKQLEETIAAETSAKAASYKEEEEKNLLSAAKKSAERIRVTADADAYEISKKVQAGITPEVRLQMDWDGRAKVMSAIFGPDGVNMPTTVMTGGQGKSDAGMLESIIGAKILSGDILPSKK
jgi:hypothetical protein